jgi:hypothetical protein
MGEGMQRMPRANGGDHLDVVGVLAREGSASMVEGVGSACYFSEVSARRLLVMIVAWRWSLWFSAARCCCCLMLVLSVGPS